MKNWWLVLLLFSPLSEAEFFQCGDGLKAQTVLQPRIVNGTAVNISEVPWQIALIDPNQSSQFCGGSIMSPSWIVTAAHCLVRGKGANRRVVKPSEVKVGYGATNKDSLKQVSVNKIFVHEKYQDASKGFDIALIKLNQKIDLNNRTVSQVQLVSEKVTRDLVVPANCGVVSGWGTTSSGGPSSKGLLKASVPLVSRSKCQADYRKKLSTFTLAEDQICAGGDGIHDSCQGDSGGPFVLQAPLGGTGNQSILAGVVSWGYRCAERGFPGIYTNVGYHFDWIMRIYNAN